MLVDLAGMESSKKSYSVEGESSKPQRREEARHINTSLFALGSVVERLSTAKGGAAGHVPFRCVRQSRTTRTPPVPVPPMIAPRSPNRDPYAQELEACLLYTSPSPRDS